jgi:hypothetical protein
MDLTMLVGGLIIRFVSSFDLFFSSFPSFPSFPSFSSFPFPHSYVVSSLTESAPSLIHQMGASMWVISSKDPEKAKERYSTEMGAFILVNSKTTVATGRAPFLFRTLYPISVLGGKIRFVVNLFDLSLVELCGALWGLVGACGCGLVGFS